MCFRGGGLHKYMLLRMNRRRDMPTISKKELENYRQLCKSRDNGRILTPDGLRVICEGLNRDPEAIGKHMLEALARMQNNGEPLDCRHSSS